MQTDGLHREIANWLRQREAIAEIQIQKYCGRKEKEIGQEPKRGREENHQEKKVLTESKMFLKCFAIKTETKIFECGIICIRIHCTDFVHTY